MPNLGFEKSNNIFRDRDALQEEYIPDELVGRNEELSQYHSALQSVINDESPSNVFLYGKSGVGKTAATRYLLGRLHEGAEEYDDVDLITVQVNCDGLNSSYQVAVKIVNELRDSSNQIAKTGHPQSQVYEYLWSSLNDLNTVFIVLDEINYITDDFILHRIPRARDNGYVSNVKLGIIGISNCLTFRKNLSSKIRSSLCEKEVCFPPYDMNEIRAILQTRKEVAFHDDVLEDSVIPLCAAYGAQNLGNARQALNLLLTSGDIAHGTDADSVTEDLVRVAKKKIEGDRIAKDVAKLTEHARLTLYALTTLAAKGETPSTSPKIRSRYVRLCETGNKDALTFRQMQNNLSDLRMLSAISAKEKNRGKIGGKKVLYSLNYDYTLIVDTLKETIGDVGVHTSLCNHIDIADYETD